MKKLLRRISYWLRYRKLEEELNEEIEFHRAMKQRKLEQSGLPPNEAGPHATRELGNTLLAREDSRSVWIWPWAEQFWQDIRYALRTMASNKTFSALAILSLALGIGANTAIFSFMDAILLRSLPISHPETLVTLGEHLQRLRFHGYNRHDAGYDDPAGRGGVNGIFAYAAFELLQKQASVFSIVFGFQGAGPLHLAMNNHAAIGTGEYVSGNYFGGLGIVPAAGRLLVPADDRAENAAVAVVSFDWSETHFGGAEKAAGQPVLIDNVPFTVVGVTPPDFFGADPGLLPDIYVPMHANIVLDAAHGGALQPEEMFIDPSIDWVVTMARLQPGVTAAQASAAVAGPFAAWERSVAAQRPREVGNVMVRESREGIDGLRRQYSKPLFILLLLVGLILAIACANIANLLLARSAARQREMAVRLSIGAGRGRIIRQLLTESVLLAAMSGGLGLAFAFWGIRFLTLLMSTGADRFTFHANLNQNVLALTGGLSLATGILFGLAPAIQATRPDVLPALKGTAVAASRHRWFGSLGFRRSLVVVQIVLATLLLVTTALFVRTLSKLESIQLGFNRDNLLTFQIDARQAGHGDPEIISFYRNLQNQFAAIPGVRSAALSDVTLIGMGTSATGVGLAGSPEEERKSSRVLTIGPGFFTTMQIPLLKGRDLDVRDASGTSLVALVNHTFAQAYFGSDDPIGRRLVIRSSCKDPTLCGGREWLDKEMEVIGVSADTHHGRVTDPVPPVLYLPYSQGTWEPIGNVTYELRFAGNPASILRQAQGIVAQADPRVPLAEVKTQTALIDETINDQVLFARLCTIFAVLALTIACVGLYGTTSYTVAQRTNEIGIRMALGAQRKRVVRMILGEVLLLIVLGVVISIPVTLAATKMVTSYLYDVKPQDPIAVTSAIAILAAAVLAAGFLPARRASRIDPMVALRHE